MFFKFVIYAFQPFGCKVNSINKTIYLSIYLTVKRTFSTSHFKAEKKPGAGLTSQWLVGLLLEILQKTRGYIVPRNDPTSHCKMILAQFYFRF